LSPYRARQFHRIFLSFRHAAYRHLALGAQNGLTKAMAMRKTVLLADDNAFVRTALYEFFEREPDFQVCAMAENGREAIEQASRLHPDLVVLDRTMPVMSGLDAARILNNVMPRVLLIMYCATPEECPEALRNSVGVSAIVSKSESVSVLIDTCRSLLHRKAA
jgi:DNA-binding NarL/FixJ family response regulator